MAAGKVRDVMTTSVDIVDVNDSIVDVAKRMAERDIGAAPVCESGRLAGMITDRDITVKVVAAGKDPKSTKMGDVVERTEVVTVGADDSLDEAWRTMKDHKVRRLPVIDGTTVVGIVSQGDLAMNMPEKKVGDLVEAISAAP
jgi:CBS domain-containing protein